MSIELQLKAGDKIKAGQWFARIIATTPDRMKGLFGCDSFTLIYIANWDRAGREITDPANPCPWLDINSEKQLKKFQKEAKAHGDQTIAFFLGKFDKYGKLK